MKKELTFTLNEKMGIVKITIETREKERDCINFKNLRKVKKLTELSICGDYRATPKRPGCFGQIYDTIKELYQFFNKDDLKRVKTIVKIWEKWHLNDLHAGTEKQENALQAAGLTAWASQYEKCCDYLKSINLYEDRGYKFGCGWLSEILPKRIITTLERL